MSGDLSTFQLPSGFGNGNIGLSVNSGGGLSAAGLSSSTQPANPINFGYTGQQNVQGLQTQGSAPTQPTQQTSQPTNNSNNSGGGSGGPGYSGNTVNQTVAGPNGGSYRWTGTGWVYQGPSNVNAYGQTADQVAAAQAAYDKAVSDLQGYTPLLQQQSDNATQAVNQSVQSTVNQAQIGEDTLNNQATAATGQANAALRSNLGANNAYAASFGSGLSSFGQGLNNASRQQFGNNIGNIQSNLQSHIADLENQKVSAQQWGANQIAGIQNGLQQGLKQIALQVDQTDVQKANAITTIQQQAQQQINSIQAIQAQLAANIEASRQQALGYAAIYGQNTSGFQNLVNGLATQGLGGVNNALSGGNPNFNGGFYGSNNNNQNIYGSNIPNQNPYIQG